MKKLLRLALGTVTISFLQIAGAADAGKPPGIHPNILLIVSDDHGYADVGFNGSKDIPTPHLDRLARGGLICANGYVSHPFCSPTRAALMTGRYQQRFGHEHNPYFDPADHREGLTTAERLLPELLRTAGYATGWIGKWHLGAAPEFSPLQRGFGETFGFIGGGHHYWNWSVNPKAEYNVPIERNGRPVEVRGHLTTVFGREGADYVRRHREQPWFLYLAFNAPHGPQEPTPERLAQFTGIADPKRRAYAAQVSLLDDAVGEVLAAVKDSGQENRTLVFFFSDNGGPLSGNTAANNAPLRAGKGSVYEGGVRVPFVVSWPGRLTPGRFEPAVSSLDVFATSLGLAGVPLPLDRVYDSVDLLPYLTGARAGSPHASLFWRAERGQWAVRAGDDGWKMVRQAGVPDELYQLKSDLAEEHNQAGTAPERLRELTRSLDDWNLELVPPAFSRVYEPKRKLSSLVIPGKLTFDTALGGSTKLPDYAKAPFGDWMVVDGAFVAREREGETHHPSMRIFAGIEGTGVAELEVRFGSKLELDVAIYGNGAKRMIGLTPQAFWVRIGATDTEPAHVFGPVRTGLAVDRWHKIRVEVDGGRFLVTLDDAHQISGRDPAFATAKLNFALGAYGNGTAFRRLKVWRGEASPEGEVNRPTPTRPRSLEEFNFELADLNADGVLTEDEYIASRKDRSNAEASRAMFSRLDKNRDRQVSKTEFGLR